MMLQNQLTPAIFFQSIRVLRKQAPVVHNITNYVVMNISANILLAIGASPIMSHATNELKEITSQAHSLVLNIGTIDDNWFKAMLFAQKIALSRNKPIVLDPVGSSISTYRKRKTIRILQHGVSVLRGNASEILTLVDPKHSGKGVDSIIDSEDAIDAAHRLSEKYNCCVVVSGPTDIICFKNTIYYLNNGTPLLSRVTGMGCATSAIIGAFLPVTQHPMLASIYGMAVFSIAGEISQKHSHGPGSFYQHLIDTLYLLNINDLKRFSYQYKLL